MDNNDINDIVNAFANAAVRAIKAGFKVIEMKLLFSHL